MSKIISRALIAACVLAAPAAHAANVKQIAVHYDDLNLSQKAGVLTLIARLEVASQNACGGAPDIRDLKMREFFNGCVKATMDHAVASVNSPEVVAVYNGTASDDAVQVSQR